MYVHLNIIYKELIECAVITAYMKACGNHRTYKITVRTVSNCGDDRNFFSSQDDDLICILATKCSSQCRLKSL